MNQSSGLQNIKYIIGIASGKGGVGKSTVASNLAYALNKLNYKVGLLDADIYGPTQPGLLGSSDSRPSGQDGMIVPVNKAGIKFISMGLMTADKGPVIMRAPMASKAISQFLTGVLWGDLDFLLVDMPPGTGDIQLTISQQARLSGVIIVTTPQKLAADIAKKGLQMFETLAVPVIGVIENMSGFSCAHCNEVTEPFRKGGGRKLAEDMKVPFLGELPLDPNIMMSSDEGINLQEEDETAGSKAFMKLADTFLVNLKNIESEARQTDPEKIEHDETTVRVLWKDGTKSEVDAYTLRCECPCALCVDENSGKRILRKDDVSLTIKALAVRPVGRYGIMIEFSDGHSKGIYRFKKLKELAEKDADKSFIF